MGDTPLHPQEDARCGEPVYHLNVKLLRRSDGRSATAAAAYRSGSKITDVRTGLSWDYRRKKHVFALPLVLPEGTPAEFADRATFWNLVEVQAKRQDAQVAREVEVAIPHGLTPENESLLVERFAEWLSLTYQIVVDACIHRLPGNHHAHLLTSTCKVGSGGIGNKARALDLIAARKADATAESPVELIRLAWEDLANEALSGTGRRVDRRTLVAQGIDREPQRHQGPTAAAMTRRGANPNRTRTPRPNPNPEEYNHEAPKRRRPRWQDSPGPDHAPRIQHGRHR